MKIFHRTFALALTLVTLAGSSSPVPACQEIFAPHQQDTINGHDANGNGDLIIRWNEDKNELDGFSVQLGRWTKLKTSQQQHIQPQIGQRVAAVPLDAAVAGFSAVTGKWELLKLDADTKPIVTARGDVAFVQTPEHVYTFSARSGRWQSPSDPDYVQKPLNSAAPVGTATVVHQYPAPHTFYLDSREVESAKSRRNAVYESERKALVLAAQLREQDQRSDGEVQKLNEAVTKAFDERLKAQEAQLEPLRQKLKHIESTLQKRQEHRRQIIERRVNELLNPDIRWTTDPTSRPQPIPGVSPVSPLTSPGPGEPGMDPGLNSPIDLPGPPHLPLNVSPTTNMPTPNMPTAPRASVYTPDQPDVNDPSQPHEIPSLHGLLANQAASEKIARRLSEIQQAAATEPADPGNPQRLKESRPLYLDLKQSHNLWEGQLERLESEQRLLELELKASKLNHEHMVAQRSRVTELTARNLASGEEALDARLAENLAKIDVEKVQARIEQLQKLIDRVRLLKPVSIEQFPHLPEKNGSELADPDQTKAEGNAG